MKRYKKSLHCDTCIGIAVLVSGTVVSDSADVGGHTRGHLAIMIQSHEEEQEVLPWQQQRPHNYSYYTLMSSILILKVSKLSFSQKLRGNCCVTLTSTS